MARVLIAGCGDVGGALGADLAAAGHDVWGIRRNVSALPEGIEPLAADLAGALDSLALPAELDLVFYTAAPDQRNESAYRRIYVDGLRRILELLQQEGQSPRRVFFTSSTAVYGQRDGEWVDESSPTEPASFSGRLLLEAERVLSAAPWPSTCVRLAGIYGPGRLRLVRLARDGAPVRKSPPVYTNRIHRDDCAGLLHFLARLERPESLYLGVDDRPAPRAEVLAWIRRRMGLPEPPEAEVEQDTVAPSKRCSNRRSGPPATDFDIRPSSTATRR